ncbi:MAG: SGNH/GDSL hydrolase family protein, partial [Gemmatimonadota bacterium]|nr:SGNH/GDSL hydrolase family protein [Gemmatimonadota bacterium]
SMAGALERLAALGADFERDYRRMLGTVLERGLPTAVCTIYNGRFPDPTMQRQTSTALIHFNDAILRAAAEAGVPVVELRLVCTEDADYANPIEPSSHGGEKIARAIARLVTEHDFSRRRTEVYVG